MRKLIACLVGAFLVATLPRTGAAAEVTTDFFYTSLEPYGEWVDAADYGYVWHPRDTAEDWRPYTEGSWAYTDAGWTWVSDEPFGAITYHYGRWVQLADVGWSWVPDTEWAPAWVSWRRSEKHIGWAPLPPEARFERTVGIKAWADTYYDIGPSHYTFVDVRQLGAPKIRSVILPQRENVTIIRETRNITNITVENNYVFTGGPEYDVVVRESAEPIRRLRIERRNDVLVERDGFRADSMQTQILGGALRVVAPEVVLSREVRVPRDARRIEHVDVNRGWRDLGPQADQLRTVIAKDTPKPPAELPPRPRFEKMRDRVAQKAPVGAQSDGAAPAPADAAAGNRDRMRERSAGAGQPPQPSDKPPVTTSPGVTTAPGDKPAATTERPLPPNGRRPKDSAAPPDRPDAPPTAGNRRARDGKRNAAEADPATPGKPEAMPPAGAPEKPPAPEPADTPAGIDKPRPSRPKGPAAPDAPERGPGQPDGKGRPDRPAKPDPAPRGTPGAEPGDRPQRPERSERPERPKTEERPAKPAAPEGAERPARPEGADRPARPEAPARPERPDAPAGRGAGGGARPEGANPGGVPGADRAGGRPEAPAAGRGAEGKRKPGDREAGKKGADEDRGATPGQ